VPGQPAAQLGAERIDVHLGFTLRVGHTTSLLGVRIMTAHCTRRQMGRQ
jgi:hypothetical protein